MKTYEDYFSDDAILECLCRIRVNRASAIHERRFYRKVFHLKPETDFSELNKIFPPRKLWHRFRPRKDKRRQSNQHNFVALRKCISWHRRNAPSTPWVRSFNQFLASLQKEVLSDKSFRFSTPQIVPQPKKGKNEFRAIASFPDIKDKIVDIINAKYLRECLEPCFEDSCRAFRSGSKRHLNRNSAIDDIFQIREQYPEQPLYVTECDIRGFFDCVHHQVAKNSLKRVIDSLVIRSPNTIIDSRAILYFERYLDAYTFSKTTRKLEKDLQRKTKNPNAKFKWPLGKRGGSDTPNTLNFFHANPKRCNIGVPQGGAHSCLIANLILDIADKEVCLALHAGKGDALYLRYCDDIIIITSDESLCRKATEVYCLALRSVKLPYHLPAKLNGDLTQFYEESKTKECYRWGKEDGDLMQFPWIQFLGYHIRYDAKIRIRPSSIKKQKEKIANLGSSLRRDLKRHKSKVSEKRLMYRFNSKLWAFSTGRVQIHIQHTNPLPMCWASGFRQLGGRAFSPHHVRSLDKYAGSERRRLRRFIKKSRMGKKSQQMQSRHLNHFGKPFSHLRQFQHRNIEGETV